MRAPLLLSGALAAMVALVGAFAACTSPDAATQAHPIVAGAKYTECSGCHMADYAGARDHAGKKPTTCGVCHQEHGWHPQWLEHPWLLTGAHLQTDCFECHKGNPTVFKDTSKECVACHRAEYDKTPGHAERFPTTCDECHSTFVWKTAYWVDDQAALWLDGGAEAAAAAQAAQATQAPDAAVEPVDAAPAPVDAAVAKPRWVPPPHPTGVPTIKPTTTPTTPPTTPPTTTKPDVTSHPSPRH